MTPVLFISTRTKKKCSLRNGGLKASRASETEEQRKERLTIGREKGRTRRITKKLQQEKKRSSETEDHEKQHLVTLKRLKRGDENELERKLRLEKVVSNYTSLRLAVETEEERRLRLENDADTKWLSLAMQMDEERKARLEKMVATKRLKLAMETDKKRKARLEKMVATTQFRLIFGLRLEF